MDYLKKKLQKENISKAYEELDTRIASGWYVDNKANKKFIQQNFFLGKYYLKQKKF